MRKIGVGRLTAVFGFALGGLVAGHAVDYVVTFPSAGHRHAFLELSGHAHMHTLRPISIGLALLAAVMAVWMGSRQGGTAGRGRFRHYALSLIAFQTLGFLTMEIGERLTSQAGLSTLPIGLLALGIVIQVAIALIAAFVLVGLELFGASLTHPRPVRVLAPSPARQLVGRLTALSAVILDSVPPRAPPATQLT